MCSMELVHRYLKAKQELQIMYGMNEESGVEELFKQISETYPLFKVIFASSVDSDELSPTSPR